jgi:hypothetical protein
MWQHLAGKIVKCPTCCSSFAVPKAAAPGNPAQAGAAKEARSDADRRVRLITLGGLATLLLLAITLFFTRVSLDRNGSLGFDLGFWPLMLMLIMLAGLAGYFTMAAVRKYLTLSLWECLIVGTYGFVWFLIFSIHAAGTVGIGI